MYTSDPSNELSNYFWPRKATTVDEEEEEGEEEEEEERERQASGSLLPAASLVRALLKCGASAIRNAGEFADRINRQKKIKITVYHVAGE